MQLMEGRESVVRVGNPRGKLTGFARKGRVRKQPSAVVCVQDVVSGHPTLTLVTTRPMLRW